MVFIELYPGVDKWTEGPVSKILSHMARLSPPYETLRKRSPDAGIFYNALFY